MPAVTEPWCPGAAGCVLDGGAYCGEGGFFAQMAAMHACGPYVIETVNVESSLVYTNSQPSGSIRAPTAPQVCWAVEQHMDELAEALGLDPVELRRRTLIEEGAESPTKQVFDRIGAKETLERAAELIGYGEELPEGEGIGVSCGWWPSFAANSGAYVKLNADGTGTIMTGAQENGSGAVMALPILVAEVLGMDPEDFSLLYQDTDAGPTDNGSCGSQTTLNNGRAVVAAADGGSRAAPRPRRRAARGSPRRPRARRRARCGSRARPSVSVAVAELAEATPLLGKGSGEVPDDPPVEAMGCAGRHGLESFLAPQLITHAARVKVDRETGVTRVLQVAAVHDCGVILNRMGADGQVYGGVVMGIGQALSEVTQFDEEGQQLNPHLLDYKLVTASDAPRIDIDWIEIETPNAGPKGSKGVGEPPCVPTAGAIANAIARADRSARTAAAHDPRAGVGRRPRRRRVSSATFVAATTVEEAVQALASGARPVAGGTDLVVGFRQGKAPLPDSLVAIHTIEELRGITPTDGGAPDRSARHPRGARPRPGGARTVHRPRRRGGDRRLARNARAGDARRAI